MISSNYDGNISFNIRENTDSSNWLTIQRENHVLKIWVDSNTSGKGPRRALLVITNGSGETCLVEVAQDGNKIVLKDESGNTLQEGFDSKIWFNDEGKYNGDGLPSFYVETLIGSYSCSVEYEEGTEEFLSVSALTDHIIIKCQPNQGYERAATLIIQSGNIIKRYRIVQQAKQIFVTYQQVRGQYLYSKTIQQDYGSQVLKKNSGMVIPESYMVDRVVVPFVGWRTDTDSFIAPGARVYEDTTCLAVYAKMQMFVTDEKAQIGYEVNRVEFDSQGEVKPLLYSQISDDDIRQALEEQYGVSGFTHSDYVPGKWRHVYVRYIEFPGNTNGEVPYVGEDCDFTVLITRGWHASEHCYRRTNNEEEFNPDEIDTAWIWDFEMFCAKYEGETVLNDKGEEVFAPYDNDRQAIIHLLNESGKLLSVPVRQTPPVVERQGWNEGLMYYGITKEQFYDARYTGGATPIQGCSVNVSHSITKRSDGVFTNKSTFQISYTGEGSFVAIGEQDKVYSYYVKDLVLEKFRIVCEHYTLCALAEGEVSYTNGIDKIVESLGDAFGKAWTTITFVWDKYIDKSPAAKFIDRLQVLVEVATIPIDLFLDYKLAGVRDTKEYWANVANAFINTYDLYWTNSDGVIEQKIDSGFLYSVRNGKVAEAQKCNGSHTFDENEMVIIGKLESK